MKQKVCDSFPSAELAGRFYKRSGTHLFATRPLERDKLYYIRNLVKQYQVMKKLMVTQKAWVKKKPP